MVLVGALVNPIDIVRTWKDASIAQRVPMQSRETHSGLKIHVPETGDQSWDSDLPSTPYFSPNLELRDSGSMRKGFVKRHRKEGGGK